MSGVALVDGSDAAAVSVFRWFLDPKRGWARRREKQPNGRWPLIDMHRFVLGIKRGDRRQVIHRNGDGLDNRRENLQLLSPASIMIRGKIAKISLANSEKVASVDTADVPLVQGYRWHLDGGGYVRAHIPGSGAIGQKVHLHRLIVAAKPRREVDHIDGDPLNNRRSNLRYATRKIQAQNRHRSRGGATSRHLNVYWNTQLGKWMVRVYTDGVSHYGGSFHDEQEAAEQAKEMRRDLLPHSQEARDG